MTEQLCPDVCAVVVSYHPDPVVIRSLVDAVAGQVGAVVLIDNGGVGAWQPAMAELLQRGGGAVLQQPHNVGLASAQNIGIDWAREHGFRQVMLLDQDSEPGEGMVAALQQALAMLSASGKVAAVGPRFHDVREDRDAPFVRLGFPLNRRAWCVVGTTHVRCDFLISSGALIPVAVLDQVGPMDAGLFIDNVDMEWGFRAQAHGYALYGVCAATMHHRLGDARHALPLGGRIVVHGPLRLYYMMRNRLLLYQMAHVPLVWKAQDMLRVPAKLFLFGVLIGPRLRNLRYMLRGLWDGLRGRRGSGPPALS
ncbi:MAG: glycosyltransferase family 2 protein [Rhodanobacter sp.]